jgi:prepilin-type processing-associated H-X9-DG protein
VPIVAPEDRAHFAFADGHVELLGPRELADFTTGKSTYRALWSPVDQEIELADDAEE